MIKRRNGTDKNNQPGHLYLFIFTVLPLLKLFILPSIKMQTLLHSNPVDDPPVGGRLYRPIKNDAARNIISFLSSTIIKLELLKNST